MSLGFHLQQRMVERDWSEKWFILFYKEVMGKGKMEFELWTRNIGLIKYVITVKTN